MTGVITLAVILCQLIHLSALISQYVYPCFRHETYGDIYVLYFLTRVWIITRSPNVLKTLLVDGDQSVFVKTLKLHTHNIFGAR